MVKLKFSVIMLILAIVFVTACGKTAETQSASSAPNDGASASASASASPSSGDNKPKETIKLKVVDSLPTTNILSKEGMSFWMNRVVELTNGQVQFDHYPAGQLGGDSAMLELLKSKVGDIAWITPGYFGDDLILSTVGDLPGTFKTTFQGSQAYYKLIRSDVMAPEFEKHKIRPVWAAVLPPYQASTMKKIESINDFKGLNIRSTGANHEYMMNLLGANPISMGASDLYVSLQRGTIDGFVFAITNWESYKLQELVKYSTTNGYFGSSPYYYAINTDVWNGLPDDVKAAMDQAGQETMEHIGKLLDTKLQSYIEQFAKENNVNMYQLSDEMLAEINQKIQPVRDRWVERASSKGYDGKAVLEQFLKFVEESPLE